LKIFKEKTKHQSFFGWDERGYTMNMKWGGGAVMDILVVDAYSGMELCMPIFLSEASNKIS
jgi:hypothetical protein